MKKHHRTFLAASLGIATNQTIGFSMISKSLFETNPYVVFLFNSQLVCYLNQPEFSISIPEKKLFFFHSCIMFDNVWPSSMLPTFANIVGSKIGLKKNSGDSQ
jgi:hypothetical protein